LIDPSSEESIAQAIEYVIQNPTIAKQIGQKGKEKIKHFFSKETMATKSIVFYEKTQNSFSAKQLHLKN
jgi:glycosyltransferase involved in cell wall biosynthesis